MTVAVIGAGRMGAGMVRRLRERGIDTVVFNRTREKAEALTSSGARVASTAREAVENAEFVLVSLANDEVVRSAYNGPDGVVAGLHPGEVVLEASTIAPETIAELRPLVEDKGAALLDTPVSGSVQLLERGELTVMVGGDATALERARPVLDAIATKVFHVGPSGTGATMKLVVNSVLAGLNQALSESLVLAELAGVDRRAAYDVLSGTAVAAPYVHYKRAAFENPEAAPVAFSLELVAKDLDLIAALADRVGARMDQAATDRKVVREAILAGLGDRDLSALAVFLREVARRDRAAAPSRP